MVELQIHRYGEVGTFDRQDKAIDLENTEMPITEEYGNRNWFKLFRRYI